MQKIGGVRCSAVGRWVGDGGVMGMSSVERVRSAGRVGEMKCGGRTGGGMWLEGVISIQKVQF